MQVNSTHAETKFKRKERQAAEGVAARAEHESEMQAIRERTAQLRALRLAKEAAASADRGKAAKSHAAMVRRK